MIQNNFGTIMIITFMLIFISTNQFFEKGVIRIFRYATFAVLVLVVVDSIEYWTASLPEPIALRIWMSAIGYTIRPMTIFLIVLLLLRGRKEKKFLMALPSLINGIIAFSALFTDVAYSYSETNEFVRGPLGYAAFVTSGFYLILLVIMTIHVYKDARNTEAFITIAIALMSSVATAMESIWKYEGVINMTGAAAIAFYYLYLNTQQFKRDPLTNALNRRCFYLDASKNFSALNAVVSIDLNNLKQLNDFQGHAEGDKAICTMVQCVRKALLKNCYLYRTGGDEFMLLCFKQSEVAVKHMIEKIKEEMAKTPYTCAIGMAYMDVVQNFVKLCKDADEAMYIDKAEVKKKGISNGAQSIESGFFYP